MQKGLDLFLKRWYENYHDAELGFRAWFGFIYAKLPPKRSFFITSLNKPSAMPFAGGFFYGKCENLSTGSVVMVVQLHRLPLWIQIH